MLIDCFRPKYSRHLGRPRHRWRTQLKTPRRLRPRPNHSLLGIHVTSYLGPFSFSLFFLQAQLLIKDDKPREVGEPHASGCSGNTHVTPFLTKVPVTRSRPSSDSAVRYLEISPAAVCHQSRLKGGCRGAASRPQEGAPQVKTVVPERLCLLF